MRLKMLLIFVPLVIISLSAITAMGTYFSLKYLNQSNTETAVAIGEANGERIGNLISRVITQLEDLAATQSMKSNNREQMLVSLDETFKRLGIFDLLFRGGPDGKNGMRQDGFNLGDGSQREYYQKIMKDQIPYVSVPTISKTTGKISVMCVAPVKDNGNFVGVVGGTYSFESIAKIVSQIKFKETGYALLFDNAGNLVVDSKNQAHAFKIDVATGKVKQEQGTADVKGVDERLVRLFQASAAQDTAQAGCYKSFDGVEQMGVFVPVHLAGGQRWMLLIQAPESETLAASNELKNILILSSVIFVVLAILIVIIYSTRFTKPLQLMAQEATLLAGGDLHERNLAIQSQDEIGQLANNLQIMSQKWRGIVGSVQDDAQQVAAASEELNAGAVQSAQVAQQVSGSITKMAAGSSQQIQAISATADIIQSLAANMEELAATANDVSSLATRTVTMTRDGGLDIEKAVQQINSVGQESEHVIRAVTIMQESSERMTEMVSAISNIAGQTNLLALNAAIEAARAGEAGHGFAVVADEVRKLAEQSAETAQEIAGMIQKNNTGIVETVALVEGQRTNVVSGVSLVNAAGEKFGDIAELIENLSEQVQQILKAIDVAAQNSQHIVDVTVSIETVAKEGAAEAQAISAATEEQAASMDEIRIATENLAKRAQTLQNAVNHFKM